MKPEKLVRVKLLTGRATMRKTYDPGDVIEVGQNEAQLLIKREQAVAVKEPTPEPPNK